MFKLLLLVTVLIVQVHSNVLKLGEDGWFWEENPNEEEEYVYPGDCNSEPDSGFCFGSLENYFYDPKTNTCQMFIYGGCGGNYNNFFEEEECLKACAKK